MANLMIIDDDEDFATAAATALQEAGHEVQIQLETESAIARIEKTQPALIILDVMFPENSAAGFELARSMRQHSEKVRSIPVLMLTAVNSKFPLGFGSRDINDEWLPVSDFLEKPVDLHLLCSKVAALLSGRSSGAYGENKEQGAE